MLSFAFVTCLASTAAPAVAVGPARVVALDPSTGRATLLVDRRDEGAAKTERLLFTFDGGVGSESTLCTFTDDAPPADVTACRQKGPDVDGAIAPFAVTLAGHAGKAVEASGRVDAVDVTLAATWGAGDSGWSMEAGPAPAAAGGGKTLSVEVRAAGARQARVVLPFRSSEGLSWDDVTVGLACRSTPARPAPCLLVVVAVGNDANNGITVERVVVSAPFEPGAVPLDVEGACAGSLAVAVVADPGILSTAGERVAASLARAGCTVRSVEPSKAKRGKNVVYAGPAHAGVAQKIAAALGGTVEPLTWKSNAAVVVAVGR